MQIPIKRTLERLPGGMMIGPLALGGVIANLAPGLPQFFGSFTGALFTGALPILAVFYVCVGATLSVEATPYILKKGGTLFALKIACGLAAGLVLRRVLGAKTIDHGV